MGGMPAFNPMMMSGMDPAMMQAMMGGGGGAAANTGAADTRPPREKYAE